MVRISGHFCHPAVLYIGQQTAGVGTVVWANRAFDFSRHDVTPRNRFKINLKVAQRFLKRIGMINTVSNPIIKTLGNSPIRIMQS